jgi:hypothetical protein
MVETVGLSTRRHQAHAGDLEPEVHDTLYEPAERLLIGQFGTQSGRVGVDVDLTVIE